MKKIYYLFFALLFSGLAACSSGGENGATAAKSENGLLSPKDFQAKMNELSNEFLIDLRSHGELHSIGPIEGARNIDFNRGSFEKVIPRLPQDQPIMLYCASGGRSAKAASMLKEAGFTQVYDLDSGITGWQEAGLPIQAHHHH